VGCGHWFSTKVALKNKVLRIGDQDYFGAITMSLTVANGKLLRKLLLCPSEEDRSRYS
jgi:hypothetical protein